MLGDLAVRHDLEIAVLEQALRWQKKKLWTSWLTAEGWHPLTMGLRVVRNLAGGGDRAALKLEIARMEMRQAELTSQLRNQSTQAVLAYEMSQRQLTATKAKLVAHQTRWQIFLIEYRLGGASTEAMLQLWQTEIELQQETEQSQAICHQRLAQIMKLLLPGTSQ